MKDTCGLLLGLTLTAEAPTASLPSAFVEDKKMREDKLTRRVEYCRVERRRKKKRRKNGNEISRRKELDKRHMCWLSFYITAVCDRG